jgi:hypothetical protein
MSVQDTAEDFGSMKHKHEVSSDLHLNTFHRFTVVMQHFPASQALADPAPYFPLSSKWYLSKVFHFHLLYSRIPINTDILSLSEYITLFPVNFVFNPNPAITHCQLLVTAYIYFYPNPGSLHIFKCSFRSYSFRCSRASTRKALVFQ